MSVEQFRTQIAELSAALAGRPLDASLDAWLNAEHGAGSATYAALKAMEKLGTPGGQVRNPPRIKKAWVTAVKQGCAWQPDASS